MKALVGLAEECERAGALSDAEAESLGVLINEALGIASYITDDGNPVLSLDAAMKLVPEGWQFGCGSKDATCRAWAWVGSGSDPMDRADHISNAATPALALTAACLKARAAQAEKQ